MLFSAAGVWEGYNTGILVVKRIGIGPFCYAAVEEIHFPDSLKGVMMDAVPSNAIATG